MVLERDGEWDVGIFEGVLFSMVGASRVLAYYLFSTNKKFNNHMCLYPLCRAGRGWPSASWGKRKIRSDLAEQTL